MNTIHVQAIWDSEAEVWVATSEDVPGLVAEASTIPELRDRLDRMIPELLRENNVKTWEGPEVPLDLLVHDKLKLAEAC